MIPALSLDASDDTDSPAPDHNGQAALQVVRLRPECLSSLTDTAVTGLRELCSAQFNLATHNADKADWVHNLAACIVEMNRRGLPIGVIA